MRIVLIGQAAFGAEVLEKLAKKGEEVAGVFCPTGGRGDRLKQVADKLGIAVYQVPSMKTPDVYSKFTELAPDLGVMAFVTDIVPLRILCYPKLGTIQYHPSLLPKHRGGSAINWAMIQGDTRTGITIFWPDRGVDTGPILLQRAVDISPDDTMGTLYFNKLYPSGIEAMLEAVELVRRGTAPRIPQDESQATSEGLCNEAIIDWRQPAPAVYNLIRGTNPSPGATTFFEEKPVKVFDCELCPEAAGGQPGQVLEIGEKGIKIAAGGGAILVKRVQPEGMPKMEAAAYAKSVGLAAGSVLA